MYFEKYDEIKIDISKYIGYNTDQELSPDVLEVAANIIQKMEKKNILNMIDDALDKNNKKSFMEFLNSLPEK